MRTFLSTITAFLLLGALVIQSQAPEAKGEAKGKAKGKGGFTPKNLQVLSPATFPNAMQTFVQSLGLVDKGACSYCHVDDRSSDEKMTKLTARNMIIMVRELNARFPDGKQHVSCWTCHRGSTTPAVEP